MPSRYEDHCSMRIPRCLSKYCWCSWVKNSLAPTSCRRINSLQNHAFLIGQSATRPSASVIRLSFQVVVSSSNSLPPSARKPLFSDPDRPYKACPHCRLQCFVYRNTPYSPRIWQYRRKARTVFIELAQICNSPVIYIVSGSVKMI